MFPPVYEIAAQYPDVLAVLGSPPRLTAFGMTKKEKPQRPYAVWQTVYGNPDNSLSCIPTEDLFGVQVDCYADQFSDARTAAKALRDAFESSYNPVTAWNGEFWETATGLYRVSFTAEFWTTRTGS